MGSDMKLSCGLPASVDHVHHAVMAEQLGYERVFFTDSPAFYEDVWMVLALAAGATRRVTLGPAVLVPGLRHVIVTAAALGTLEKLAPGRVVAAVGTGFSGRMALGQKPLPWAAVDTYLNQLRGLLRGDQVLVDGKQIAMLQPPIFGTRRPIEIDLIVAANGPRGLAVARRHDGVMAVMPPAAPVNGPLSLAVLGTVLDDDEPLESDRVMDSAGPAAASLIHGMYEKDPDSLRTLVGADEWRADAERYALEERHLHTHEGHVVDVPARDKKVIRANPHLVSECTFTGTRTTLRDKLTQLNSAGVGELVFFPAGDIERELRAFRELS
jgi:5,10-methylenetetrahydromethanopterin reductase